LRADITHEEDRAATEARIAEAYEGLRRVHRVEKRYLRKDGGVMWVDVSTVFVPASGSTSAFFSVVIADITERKRSSLFSQILPLEGEIITRGTLMLQCRSHTDLRLIPAPTQARRLCSVAQLENDSADFHVF